VEPVCDAPGDADEVSAIEWAMAASLADAALRATSKQGNSPPLDCQSPTRASARHDEEVQREDDNGSNAYDTHGEAAPGDLHARLYEARCEFDIDSGISSSIDQGNSTDVPRGNTTTVPAGGTFGVTSRGQALRDLTQVSPACPAFQTASSERLCLLLLRPD